MKIIKTNGKPEIGRYLTLPTEVNWRDFDARNSMGRKRLSLFKPFLFKHFDFYGVQNERFTFGCGLVRLGLVNSAFVYLYSDATGLIHRTFDLPLDLGMFCDLQVLGESGWTHPFKANHWIRSKRTAASRELTFQFGYDLHGKVTLSLSEKDDVLAMTTPIANTGFAYAQKTSGVPVSGAIYYCGQKFEINPEHDGCYHDWTAGFLRRETFWNWACATGRAKADSPLVSVNLACGVNETSAHENVVWVNGKMHDLPLVTFEYDRDNVQKAWTVSSACKRVDLKFIPIGKIQDHRNLIVLASRFNQCFGVFTGSVTLENGEKIKIDGLKGWCEDHYAKW